MTAKLSPRKLKGFRDYLPTIERRRQQFTETIYHMAQIAGYEPVATPSLEYADTLLGSGGEETDKEVYRFTDHGERDVALRFDLTVPFARFAAENLKDLVLPFKRVQCAEVWRGEKPQKGRYREFRQCDLDIIGADTLVADVDVILTMFRMLEALTLPSKVTVAIGNRPVLSGLIQQLCAPQMPREDFKRHETAALIAIDKLAKIGAEKVGAALAQVFPTAGSEVIAQFLVLLTKKDERGNSDLEAFALYFKEGPAALEWRRFQETVLHLRTLTKDTTAGKIVADLGIARGLGYYTGVVFETTFDDLPGFGSISSGGRYNNLAERFTTQELQGVGGSIGLDRLLAGLEELEKEGGEAPRAGIFVAVATAETSGYALEIVDRLRRCGLQCDLSAKLGKLGNQFRLADRRRAHYVVTVGPDEERGRTANLKNMESGAETKGLGLETLIETLVEDPTQKPR